MNKFIFPLKIYIEDSDYGGVVYHANYLKFYERARSEWGNLLGMDMAWQLQHKIFFVVRAVTIDFIKPVRVNDQVEVVTSLDQLTQTSASFRQYLRSAAAPDTILNTAEVRVVCINEQFRPQSLPRCPFHEILTGEKT